MTINEAVNLIAALPLNLPSERVLLPNAHNRVLASDIFANFDAPRFTNSAMDGYAVNGAELTSWQIAGEPILAGDFSHRKIAPGECCKIMTGALLPEGADAVLMVENAEATSTKVQNTSKALKKGEAIRYAGEEYKKGALLLERSRRLDAAALMLAAANGYYELEVFAKAKVGIFASGDELLEPYERGEGVYNSNSYGIGAIAASFANVQLLGRLADDYAATLRALDGAAGCFDLLITIGAASKGDADFVKKALFEAGFCEHFSHLELKPGGPVGLYARGKELVLTLPGNPMSAYACMQLLSGAFSQAFYAQKPAKPIFARLANSVKITNKKENLLFGTLDKNGEFIPHNGGQFSSGQISPMAACTHYARLFADNQAGDLIAIWQLI